MSILFDGLYNIVSILCAIIFFVGMFTCAIAVYGIVNEATKYLKRNAYKEETLDN